MGKVEKILKKVSNTLEVNIIIWRPSCSYHHRDWVSQNLLNLLPLFSQSSVEEERFSPEAWRAVDRHVHVSLLEPIVFLHVMEVVSSYYNRPLHLRLDHHSSQDSTTNRDSASEWTLLVNVLPFDGLDRTTRLVVDKISQDSTHSFRCLESKTNTFVVPFNPLGILGHQRSTCSDFWFPVTRNSWLFLEGSFVLKSGKN